MTEFILFAHRGASGHEPENTLRAFRRALESGAEWIELDVHAVEGEPVVFHDFHLDHRTNGTGPIGECTLEYIRSLDAGKGERIPLLREVMAFLGGKAGVNVELKGPGTADPTARVLAESLSTPFWNPSRMLVSSFYLNALARFHALLPDVPIGALFAEPPPPLEPLKAGLNCTSVHIEKDSVSRETVEEAHSLGLRVFVYTVNEPDDAGRLRALGVDGIFSDFPERFL